MASNAVRRLTRELANLQKCNNPQLLVRPAGSSLLVWHFALHSLPADTPYKGGCYHGKLVFTDDYPHAPPQLLMITPSGRLETNKRLCLSMTDYHPETWNPAWSIESILVGLISFMIDERDPNGLGVVHAPAEKRRQFARDSWKFNVKDHEFCELFPELAREPHPEMDTTASGSSEPPRNHAADENIEVESLQVDEDALARAVDEAKCLDEMQQQLPTANAATVSDIEDQNHPLRNALCPADAGTEVSRGCAAEERTTVQVAVVQDSESSEPQECWICREDASVEPLIQPCACRGSMSGVHASCVEQWIRHHRANAASQEPPKCSVCGHAYSGTEWRPGPMGFAKHICGDFIQQAGRSAVLVGVLVAYWASAQSDAIVWWIRLPLFLASSSFFIYKALLLVVSLPRGRPPPENFLRYFCILDFRLLVVHIAEALASVVITALWVLYGQLPYIFFLPLCLLVILPLISILVRYEGTPCSLHAMLVVLFIIGSPILVLIHLARLAWHNPKRLLDPCDGLVHIFVPLITMPLCWFAENNIPVLVVWAFHAVMLAGGVVEHAFVKRLPWKEGRTWWIFLQLSVLAVYVGNLISDFDEGLWKEHSSWLVFGLSFVWLALVSTLVIQVNWELCVQQYRAWQHRNGSFSLRAVNAGSPQPQTIGAAEQGVARPAAPMDAGSIGVVPHQPEAHAQVVPEEQEVQEVHV